MRSGRASASRPIRRRSSWPTPPTTASSHGGSDAENSVVMYLALKRAGIPAELHIYATGDHDFGVRQNEKLPSSWTAALRQLAAEPGIARPGRESVGALQARDVLGHLSWSALSATSWPVRSASPSGRC